ncbi:MAG: thioesterase domain-containing protein [Desulfuromonadales bacterium]
MSDAVTLFCFPFAGGNVYSYRPFERVLNPAIKVVPLEPPGRGRRSQESCLKSMHEIALDMVSCMRTSLDKPYALFGHSMGALSAYLVTCQLVKEQLPLPLHLFISGKGPPHGISREAQWHTLPPEEFKSKLAELGGCATVVLEDRELFAYFEPIIREDMRAIAEYQHTAGPPLEVPITVMIGTTESTTCAEASQWNDMTTYDCSVLQYEGDHFFLFDHIDSICALLNSTLLDS